MNTNIINVDNSVQMKEKHGNSEEWKNYARRLQKNPYAKKAILKRYDGKCQFCGKDITTSFVIHHKTYDRECLTGSTTRIPNPTLRRPKRTTAIPLCEKCDGFTECTAQLYPVHVSCNRDIEKIYEEGA